MEAVERLYCLGSWDQVRALADPLRVRILRKLAKLPMTVDQLAIAFEQDASALAEHVAYLESEGLIRTVPRKRKRQQNEKYYQAVAEEFQVERSKLPKGGSGYGAFESLFITGLEATLEEAKEAMSRGMYTSKEGGPNPQIYRLRLEGTDAEIRQVIASLKEVAQDAFDTLPDQGMARFGLTIALYPLPSLSERRML